MAEAEKTLKSKSGDDFFKALFSSVSEYFCVLRRNAETANLLHKAIFNWL